MTRWFIDALDPRAGIAVATARDSDLKHPGVLRGGQSVHIAPPTFVPVFIETRAIGFGLTRSGSAQLGLFDDEEEVPFDGLAAVVEFVRRVYLRGTGGDGPGENGSGGPPIVPEGREGPPGLTPLEGERKYDRGERGEEHTQDPVEAVGKFAQKMRNAMMDLPIGHHKTLPTLQNIIAFNQADNSWSRRLARGALITLVELLFRRPPNEASAGFLQWIEVLHRLTAILLRMGLWSFVADEARYDHKVSKWIMGNRFSSRHPLEIFVYNFLRSSPPDVPWDFYWNRFCCGPLFQAADPFLDLVSMPVPRLSVSFDQDNLHNLQALLSALVATPADALNGTSEQEARAELALFAAAYINLEADFAPLAWMGDSAIWRAFLDRLLSRTLRWLDANLPKLAYAPPVEKMINSASTIAA
jgi:hypothetical protein